MPVLIKRLVIWKNVIYILFWWTDVSHTKVYIEQITLVLPIFQKQVGSIQVNVQYHINKYGTLRNYTVSAEESSETFR